jgi:hypothetical protein
MSEEIKTYEQRNLWIDGSGMFYINTPTGTQIMVMMRDGKATSIDLHGMDEVPVSLFTDKKVSKKTRKLTVPADKWTDGFDFKVVKLTVGE